MSKVTYIEDLFDLENVNSKQNYAPQSLDGYPPKMNQDFSKQMETEISDRNQTSQPFQSKMRKFQDPRLAANAGMPYEIVSQSQSPYSQLPSHQPIAHPNDFLLIEPSYNEYRLGPKAQPPRGMVNNDMHNMHNIHNMQRHINPQDIACLDIARHIKQCPICSKFYDNDKSIYIIIIVILAICTLILLKKVLETNSN